MKLKRFLCMLLCLCMVMSLITMPASAASHVNSIKVTVDAPTVGARPGEATVTSADSQVVKTEWTDSSGNALSAIDIFQASKKYTVTVTVEMKDGVEKFFQNDGAKNFTINGKQATIEKFSFGQVVLSYTFLSGAIALVDKMSATVQEPAAGEKPGTVTSSDTRVRVTKTEWLDSSGKTLSAADTFRKGEVYTVRYTVVPSISNVIKLHLKDANILMNGLTAKLVSGTMSSAVMEYTFGPATEKLSAVTENGVITTAHFYVAEPVVGRKPVNAVSIAESDFLQITTVEWSGDFDANGCFMAKEDYSVHFKVTVRDGVALTLPTSNAQRKFYLNDKEITGGAGKADLYMATVRFSLELPDDVVDVSKVYSREEADALYPLYHAQDLIIDEALVKENRLENTKVPPVDEILYKDEYANATRILIDYPADKRNGESSGKTMFYHPNATEFWLSPEMDVKAFLQSFLGAKGNDGYPPFTYNSEAASTWNFTLYISGDKYPNGILNMYDSMLNDPLKNVENLTYNDISIDVRWLRFRTLLYSGDVYEAFEKAGRGEEVGKEWCPGHQYTKEIQTADRSYNVKTCLKTEWWYYSCKFCGKCEYNDKHLFAKDEFDKDKTDATGRSNHRWTTVIDDSHYLGKNAAGDPVYAYTCADCGYDVRQIESCESYYTQAMYKADYGTNAEETFAQHKARCKENWEKYTINHALKAEVGEYNAYAFAIEAEKVVTANVRASYRNDISWAAQNDLVDFALLGNDYTKDMTRLQFCSVAVRMAEKMAGKAIAPAPANTFPDTNNEYVLKAFAAGITTGQKDGTFNPNGTLTRQQMGTFLYRALMWVRDNSNIRYTTYTSKLANFTDANLLASHAKQSMPFMNALGLINGNTATTLNPNGNCTIQQAIRVAYRSLSADVIGWYQCSSQGEKTMYPYYWIPGASLSQTSYSKGDRVWVTGIDTRDDNRLIVVDPINGQPRRLGQGEFKPIKDLKDGDAELYYQYAPQ